MLLSQLGCLVLLLLARTTCIPDVQLTPEGEYSAIYFSLVNFTCLGTGNDISWKVKFNDKVLNDEELESRSITIYKHSVPAGNVSSTLVVLASIKNDDTTFACFVNDSTDVNFAFAILRVESMAPVRNLVAKESNDGVLTVWDEPMFVQNLTKIKYGITVFGSGLAIFTANNIEDLQFMVPKENLSLCSTYGFSVVAYEGSLQSKPISVSLQYFRDVNISVVDHRMMYMYEENSVSIQYFILVNTLCSGTMTVTTEVDDERTDKKMMNVDVNPNVGIYTYTALNLALGITGTVSYVIYDSVSNMKAALNVSFATHHVKSVTAFIESNGSICVECSFANGSDALGCEVEFRDGMTDDCEPCIKYAIYRISNSSSAFKCISHTCEGNFSVVAYDIVGNETSQLRAAVYNGLPEYLIVLADNNHTAVIISSASVPNASPTLEVINLTSTRVTKYTVEVSSSSLTETAVIVHTKMSLFFTPVIVSVTLFCTLLAVFILLVIAVRLCLKGYRRMERKRVFEQTSEIAEKNIYQEGGVMLYELRRSESVESNFQPVSEFVPGADSSSFVINTNPPLNSNLPYPVEATSCSPQAGSLSLSGVQEYSIPMEYSLNLPISEPINMNTPPSTKMDSSNPHLCWCSFNSERQNTLQYGEIDFKRKAPPALKPTQYSSVKARFSCVSRPTSYAPSQLAPTEIASSTQGYTEPMPSVSRVEEALYTPVSRTTTPTHLQVVDTLGFSEVPCMKKRDINETNGYCTTSNAIYEEVNKENLNSKSKHRIGSTPRTSVSSMPVTPAHDISEQPKSPLQMLDEVIQTIHLSTTCVTTNITPTDASTYSEGMIK